MYIGVWTLKPLKIWSIVFIQNLFNIGLLRKTKDGLFELNAKGQELYGGSNPKSWDWSKKEQTLTIEEVEETISSWQKNKLNEQSASD